MNLMEKKKSFFESVLMYAMRCMQACFLLSTSFSALVERRVGCGRVSYVSHQYPYIDSRFCGVIGIAARILQTKRR